MTILRTTALLAVLVMGAGYGLTASAATVASFDWTTYTATPSASFVTNDGEYYTQVNAFGGSGSPAFQQVQDWTSTASGTAGGSTALGNLTTLSAMTNGGSNNTSDVLRQGDFYLAAGQSATFTVNATVSTSDNSVGADANLSILDLTTFASTADDLFLATSGASGTQTRQLSVTVTNTGTSTNEYFFAAEANVAPVPLPASVYLMLSGVLGGLAFARRRRI